MAFCSKLDFWQKKRAGEQKHPISIHFSYLSDAMMPPQLVKKKWQNYRAAAPRTNIFAIFISLKNRFYQTLRDLILPRYLFDINIFFNIYLFSAVDLLLMIWASKKKTRRNFAKMINKQLQELSILLSHLFSSWWVYIYLSRLKDLLQYAFSFLLFKKPSILCLKGRSFFSQEIINVHAIYDSMIHKTNNFVFEFWTK